MPEERISEIRSRLDILTDNMESSMEDIAGYISEMRELLVESGEGLGE